MSLELCRAVARGAQLLDRTVPGWAEQVDRDWLEMVDMSRCILGQLGNGWAEGGMCIVLGVDPLTWRRPNPLEDGSDDPYGVIGIALDSEELRGWAVDNGFDLDPDMARHGKAWDALTHLWQFEVDRRLTPGGHEVINSPRPLTNS